MRFSVTLLLLFSIVSAFAQRQKQVEAEYTFLVPENYSVELARRTAMERAQIKAIADEFGTIVTQTNTTFVKNENGNSTVDMLSLGGSDVKGEWIETFGEPAYEQGFTKDGQMWVRCTVKGRIREIVATQIDIIAKVLRNGTEEKFEDYDFKSGDDMYLYFKSPIDGYLAVYLIDEVSRTAYCLLPYRQSSDAVQKIEHDRSYIFFSAKHATKEQYDIVDEMIMTCNKNQDRNDLYIIFSPNAFAKANSIQTERFLPRELSWDDFNKWLVRCRKRDNTMMVIRDLMTISK